MKIKCFPRLHMILLILFIDLCYRIRCKNYKAKSRTILSLGPMVTDSILFY